MDAQGDPISGLEATDLWVGLAPPDPPGSVQAELTVEGIRLYWTSVSQIPGSFEPGRGIGFYQIDVSGGTGPAVFGANHIRVPEHTVPRDSSGFQSGQDWGAALNELPDGTYHIRVHSFSVAPEGSGGSGLEWATADPEERITFVIDDGTITVQ